MSILINQEIWVTGEGLEIKVCDMGPEHVRATLNMILRRQRLQRELMEKTTQELQRAVQYGV